MDTFMPMKSSPLRHRPKHALDLRAVTREEHVEMLGESPAFLKVRQLIHKVADSDVPILVTGASGSGKELVARAIHQLSRRASGPFVPINCGAIPRDLLESELFGHEKGAFTGAYQQVKGTVERAHKGTLFLDEVGEIPLELQVKLLRFLQEFTCQRVGGRETIKVDLRIISASNCDLQELMEIGRFREDLYYRLDVIPIYLPTLSERGDDVLVMAKVFLERYAAKAGKHILGFSPEALRLFKAYSWPGNVRELINCIRRAVVLCDTVQVSPQHLRLMNGKNVGTRAPEKAAPEDYHGMSLREARARIESHLLAAAIHDCQGDAKEAAKVLKISRSMMYHLINKYDLKDVLSDEGKKISV